MGDALGQSFSTSVIGKPITQPFFTLFIAQKEVVYTSVGKINM